MPFSFINDIIFLPRWHPLFIQDRIKMELNYMLSYGAAESTILLLQRFHLLKIFLPFHVCTSSVSNLLHFLLIVTNLPLYLKCKFWLQAAYLHEQADEVSAQGSTMLMVGLALWERKIDIAILSVINMLLRCMNV